MSNTDSVAVAGTIYWAFLDRVNDMSGKYQVDVGNLSAKAVSALEDMGIRVSNKGDDKGDFITLKSNNPIRVAFAAGVEEADSSMVGNGSKAKVAVGYYDWKFRGKAGRSPSLKKMVITDLVVYGGADGAGADIDDVL